MKNILLLSVLLILLSCQNDPKQSAPTSEPQKETKTKTANCVFEQPDLTFAGMNLLDTNSTKKILGNQIKLKAKSHFYLSELKSQYIKLIVHPGDYVNAISIFKTGYTNDALKSSKNTTISQPFQSEKGIQLGITKEVLTEKLGNCFKVQNQRKNSLSLLYKIEAPQDTKDGLLKRHNLPIYYATYKFWDNKLTEIEFGFEYP